MKIVSVADYGVLPNGNMDQTKNIQRAIDEVFLGGGGEVIIPKGEYYITSLRLRSNVCLHLMEDAILIASRNAEDYFILKNDTVEPVDKSQLDESAWSRGGGLANSFHQLGSRWHNGIIRALYAENISIIGEKGSVIDGQNCFDEKGEESFRGPHGVSVLNCKNVVLRGYTVRHSGNWANMLQNCSDVTAEGLTVEAGHDGIHFTTCDNVTIRNCQFYTGDDCVAGFDNLNVLVEDCELNSACSAFRMGGTNVLIQRCHVYAPAKYMFRGVMKMEDKRAGILSNDAAGVKMRYNMLSLFTYYADYSVAIRNTPGNIIVRDCTVEGADRFLHFNYSGNEPWQGNRPLTSITFENIRATGIAMPLTAYGDVDEKCELILKNIDFSFREGFEDTTFMHVANLSTLCIEDITLHNAKGSSFVKMWGEELPETKIQNVVGLSTEKFLVRTEEIFNCKAI